MKNEWEKQQDGVIFKKIGIWDTLTIISQSNNFIFDGTISTMCASS